MSERFRVYGDGDPQVVLRVLNLFAQLDIALDVALIRHEGGGTVMDLQSGAAPERIRELVLERVRAQVLVRSAFWCDGGAGPRINAANGRP